MFAVMKTGGKQYRVTTGDVIRVERLAAEAGDKVQFNDILMVGGTVGTPLVEGAGVQGEVIDQVKADKVITFVKRRRKHSSQRTRGHRQKLTLVRITEILEKGADKSGVMAAIGTGAAGGVAAAPKAEKKAAKPAAKKAEKKAEPKAEAASEGTKPTNLLTEAREGGADDLKKISGVGPKLEGLLHENGVFHFDQIAAWNTAEIAYMDDQLSFKGRIERDDWIAQANELMKA